MSGENRSLLTTAETDSNILNYFVNSTINNSNPIESRQKKITRVAAQIGASTFLALSSIPFIRPSLEFAGDATPLNIALGWYLVGCNLTSFGILDAYSISNMIGEYIRPLSSDEVEMFSVSTNRRVDLLLRIGSVSTACILSIPRAYVGYEYNNDSALFAILAASGSIPIPSYSTYLTLNHIKSNAFLTGVESRLQESKAEVINQINSFCASLPLQTEEELKEVLSEFNALQQVESTSQKVSRLFQILQNNTQSSKDYSNEKLIKLGKYSVKVVSCGLSLSVIGYLGVVSYNFVESISDSTICGVASGTIVSACSSYLTTKLLLNASTSYYSSAVNLFRCSTKKTWGLRNNKKITIASKLIASIINAFAFAPTLQVISDNFSGFSRTYMYSTVPLSFYIICSHLSLMLVDEAMEQYSYHMNTDAISEIINFKKRLVKFANVVDKSPLIEYAKFIKILSENEMSELGNRILLTQGALDYYLSKKTETFALADSDV
ncbi:MAG: hypothetical protein SNF33_00205 (plasmid) [Candidatus Algichlamydia australiensis]|nr:hypothetical protein [Chlamydiales bacterium]